MLFSTMSSGVVVHGSGSSGIPRAISCSNRCMSGNLDTVRFITIYVESGESQYSLTMVDANKRANARRELCYSKTM